MTPKNENTDVKTKENKGVERNQKFNLLFCNEQEKAKAFDKIANAISDS